MKKLISWIIIGMCMVIGAGALIKYHQFAVSETMLVMRDEVTAQMPEEIQKEIAITFDDGPKRGTTDVLLDGLKERNVSATFFLIGMQVSGLEDLVQRMAEEGHQIGNHTFSHVNLNTLDAYKQNEEITMCSQNIRQCVEREQVCVRPPYGEVNECLRAWIGAPLILWSVDTNDWTGKTSDEIADYIVSEATAGDIILLHDIYENSVQGALMAIDRMQAQGYVFVTVEKMFADHGIILENGKVYRKV